MTPEQRAELRKAAEEATPGPWTVNGKQSVRGSFGEYIAKTNWLNGANNARHIAAANPATILQLLDYVESLERDAMRLDWMIKHHDATICADGAYGQFHIWFRYSNRTTSEAKTARAAIDAAMGEEE